ncbi:MAG: hypothetical protein J0H67_08115 [Rhodospirillales bacterium]|nr:hypothetical protein [Rhodospirillales bacterium]
MSWVTFEVEGGGLVKVRAQHVVAIYDEQGSVKLSTVAGGVHLLRDMTVQRAAALVTDIDEHGRTGRSLSGHVPRPDPRQSG